MSKNNNKNVGYFGIDTMNCTVRLPNLMSAVQRNIDADNTAGTYLSSNVITHKHTVLSGQQWHQHPLNKSYTQVNGVPGMIGYIHGISTASKKTAGVKYFNSNYQTDLTHSFLLNNEEHDIENNLFNNIVETIYCYKWLQVQVFNSKFLNNENEEPETTALDENISDFYIYDSVRELLDDKQFTYFNFIKIFQKNLPERFKYILLSKNLFEVFSSTSIEAPPGALPLNGYIIKDCKEKYPQFWFELQRQKNLGFVKTLSFYEWEEKYSNQNGNVGQFGINLENNSVRLPCISNAVFTNINNVNHQLSKYSEDRMPHHLHSLSASLSDHYHWLQNYGVKTDVLPCVLPPVMGMDGLIVLPGNGHMVNLFAGQFYNIISDIGLNAPTDLPEINIISGAFSNDSNELYEHLNPQQICVKKWIQVQCKIIFKNNDILSEIN